MMIRLMVICFLMFPGAATALRADVVVFAAASLKQPLDALSATADNVVVSYGGSGTLARQVTLGAPADIVILANTDWMDVLIAGAHVQPVSVADIAGNHLVLVGRADMPDLALDRASIDAALSGGRIATGLTEAVPAGIYAKAALNSLGLWDSYVDRLAEVDNVRAALALVDRGQTPLGIVYETDVRVTPDLRIVARFPPDTHPPIRYVAALTTDASDEAAAFLRLLLSDQGQDVFAIAGFLPPQPVFHD